MYDYVEEELIQEAVLYWMEDWTVEALKSHLPAGTKFNKNWSEEDLKDIVFEEKVHYFLNEATDQEVEMLVDLYHGIANY
jgi:hypothetical protein|tara:strand:- start:1082 stop:1321 length:240 start_codon:yes stop_codon:yes gene_type:complete